MQQFASPHTLRNEIISLAVENGMDADCYAEMLDYTIEEREQEIAVIDKIIKNLIRF